MAKLSKWKENFNFTTIWGENVIFQMEMIENIVNKVVNLQKYLNIYIEEVYNINLNSKVRFNWSEFLIQNNWLSDFQE